MADALARMTSTGHGAGRALASASAVRLMDQPIPATSLAKSL